MSEAAPAEFYDFLFFYVPRSLLESDERARGLSPLGVRAGHYCGFEDPGVLIEDGLDFERRNILTARNNNILRTVFQLDISVGVHHSQVSRVEPPSGKSLLCRGGVFEIPLHYDVPPEERFPDCLRVGRDRLACSGVADREALFHRVPHSLTRFHERPFRGRKPVPLAMPFAYRSGPVCLGEAVDVGHVEAHLLDLLQNRRRWGSRRGHEIDPVAECAPVLGFRIYYHVHHDRGPAEVRNPVFRDGVKNLTRVEMSQAYRCPREGCHGPREAPPVAVEHRERPEIYRASGHAPGQYISEGVQVGPSEIYWDALGVARRARGLVEGDRV